MSSIITSFFVIIIYCHRCTKAIMEKIGIRK